MEIGLLKNLYLIYELCNFRHKDWILRVIRKDFLIEVINDIHQNGTGMKING